MSGPGKMINGRARVLTPYTMVSSTSANGKTTNQTGKVRGFSSTGKNMSGIGAMRSQAAVAHGSSLTANSIAGSGKRRLRGGWVRNRYRLGAEPYVLPERKALG